MGNIKKFKIGFRFQVTRLRRGFGGRTGFKKRSGLGMVEAIVVIALIATTFVAILQLAFLERRSQTLAREDIAAYMLVRESFEASRSIRDEDWINITNLTFGTAYYPVINAGRWEFSSSNPGIINGSYTRWVEVGEVFRDDNDDIAVSGISDPDTRFFTSYISWDIAGGTTRTIQLEMYLTNWQNYQ